MKVKNGRRVFEAENWRQEIRDNIEGGPAARTGSCSIPAIGYLCVCVCVCVCVDLLQDIGLYIYTVWQAPRSAG